LTLVRVLGLEVEHIGASHESKERRRSKQRSFSNLIDAAEKAKGL
jgi:hypothetical protein